MQNNGLLHNPVDLGSESSVATYPCRWSPFGWWRSSLVPHVQCVQVHLPAGKWSQVAEESCSLQPVSVAKYQRKVWHSPWPSVVWSAIDFYRWNRRQRKPWNVVQTWLFEPESDFHPPYASYRQPKHGCSDCLQEGWDKSFSRQWKTLLFCSCHWQTLKKFSAVFKIVSAVRRRTCFAIRWTK